MSVVTISETCEHESFIQDSNDEHNDELKESSDEPLKHIRKHDKGPKSTWQKRQIQEKTKNNTQTICVFFWLVLLNLLLLVLICLLSYFVYIESVTPVPVTKFCVPRAHIDIHPYDMPALTTCNNTHCCFNNLNESGQILKNMTSRWLKEKLAKSNDDERKYARYECTGANDTRQTRHTKRTVDVTETATKTTIKVVAREKRAAPYENVIWNCTSDQAIICSGPFYSLKNEEKGFIEIQESGLYYVYSQINILYNTSMKEGTNTAPVDFYHMLISRQNIADASNEQILMRNTHSQCACKNDTQHFSSYLGSDMLLRKGVNLAVRVYERTVLEMPSNSNFFGIVKV